MKKTVLIIIAVLVSVFTADAQNMSSVKNMVKELSSPKYFGRGYINKGDSIAAEYLKKEFKKLRLKAPSGKYFQTYSYDVNTFPENVRVSLDSKRMNICRDYIIDPSSPSISGKYKIHRLDKKIVKNNMCLRSFATKDFSDDFVLVDTLGIRNKELSDFVLNMVRYNLIKAKGIIIVDNKIVFSARTYVEKYPMIKIKRSAISGKEKYIDVRIKNKFVEEYKTQNIISYIPGKTDSTIYFTAHYDHLGCIGDTIFPGAFDNATGVAMVTELARYFKRKTKRPKYNLVFILFSGEEAGLKGSKYYTENPLFNLDKTLILFNFDMVGSGKSGVGFFGMKDYKDECISLKEINDNYLYIENLKPTESFASSDQYYFHKKGVKAVHVYTYGDEDYYHTAMDKYGTLGFDKFEELFRLVRDYTRMKLK